MQLSMLAKSLIAAPFLLSSALAAAVPTAELIETRASSGSSCNNPANRACWTNGFNIQTDFDKTFPSTGNTVYYNLELTNGTCNPDGHGARQCLLFNGQYPGPVIRATWGDQLFITVKNSLQDNGTTIHWHGVRQYHSTGMDGVNGVTECPLAPGTSRTYSFQVTQHGTSWYHAHFSAQYGDGVVGTMIFDGPATSNYDVDLGTYPLSDWFYMTAYQINSITAQNLQKFQGPPSPDNLLVNGTNVNANGGGAYSKTTIQSGKSYRLRLINTAVDQFLQVSLDGHPFSVISTDFVPIKPFTANWLMMGIGQRYDVIITANQTADNYWFRANVARACLSDNKGIGRAIWSYSTIKSATPSSSPLPGEPQSCVEPGPLTPFWPQPVPSGSFQSSVNSLSVNFTQAEVVPGQGAVVVWALNDTSINVDWANPTLSYIFNGNTSYTDSMAVLPTAPQGQWNYWLIQQPPNFPPIAHPIHLHGHDFYVLGQGTSQYDSSSANLNFDTPPRRDTATLYGGGWLALAFKSDNPGVWMMHCHIAWHVSSGLGAQFVEAANQIVLPDKFAYDQECRNWANYQKTMYYQKDDSGL